MGLAASPRSACLTAPGQRRPRLRWCVAALLCVLAGLALVAPRHADAAQIGGFSARPAHFDPNVPATRAYFIRTVARGQGFTDEVVVSNGSTHAVSLYVDAVDGLTGVTSGAVYANRGVARHGAGLWVTPAEGEVTVPADGQQLVAFHVQVPGNATSGDHLAGLALQNVAPVRSAGEFSVTEIIRAVVGIEIKVPGPTIYRLTLGTLSLKALPGTKIPSIVVPIDNTGTKLCKPKLSVTLSGDGVDQTVTRRLDTILPGDAIPFPLPWPSKLAAGTYQAVVATAECGPVAQASQSVTLAGALRGTDANPTDAPPPGSAPPPSSMPVWELPLIAFGGVTLGIVLTKLVRGLFGGWRRRRNGARQPAVPSPVVSASMPASDYLGLARPVAPPPGPGPPSV